MKHIAAHGTLTDSRDGKKYKTVKIGEQIWMAENLNYEASGSKLYENVPENGAKYGRLYSWATAMRACPAGWHIPSNKEWDELYRYADGTSDNVESPYASSKAGKYLKSKNDWSCYGGGEDKCGFAALPSGRGKLAGEFADLGYYGNWWSASEHDTKHAYYRVMGYCFEYANWSRDIKTCLLSIRCIKD